ncbi:MAG: YdcF family protein [Mycoplasma sp.]|nr:YdcF family protein [Mycoplasma sp.]
MIISKMNVTPVKNLDYIIVLGAQVKESGPSVILRYRLDRTVSYLKENDNTLVIVSGGQGANEKATEASVMKEYLVNNAMQITNDVIGLFQAILAQNVEQTKIMLERLNNMPNIDVTKLNANVNGYIEMLEEKNRSLEM